MANGIAAKKTFTRPPLKGGISSWRVELCNVVSYPICVRAKTGHPLPDV